MAKSWTSCVQSQIWRSEKRALLWPMSITDPGYERNAKLAGTVVWDVTRGGRCRHSGPVRRWKHQSGSGESENSGAGASSSGFSWVQLSRGAEGWLWRVEVLDKNEQFTATCRTVCLFPVSELWRSQRASLGIFECQRATQRVAGGAPSSQCSKADRTRMPAPCLSDDTDSER